ncbi:DnaB-like helicase C-terminal domain-containing protein [Micromonospora tulbaghiae]|uniref:DnaB-like helicase C-terminal domain-containing protein n=1 Tax=Micromonospora tulbaghiae TaxID=479978 RepID=UPI00340E5F75
MRFLDRYVDADATPLQWLTQRLAAASAFHARVGYIDRAGVSLIASPLVDMLDRGGEAHILVDARGDRPRRADLVWLLDKFEPYRERATVTVVRDVDALHSKVFVVRDGEGKHRALIGSANFTAAGLAKNWEACVAIDSDDPAIEHVLTSTIAWRAHPAGIPVDLGTIAAMGEASSRPPMGNARSMGEMLASAIDRLEAIGTGTPPGIATGFIELDRLLGGLDPGQLVLIAGRPSMGKSTLALDLARFAAIRQDKATLLMSFEMTEAEVMQRLMSAEARVPLHVLRSGNLSDGDWVKLARAVGEIQEAPLYVNDSCSSSIRQVLAEARRAVAEDDVRLVVVDYVQLLHADRRVESRQQEVSEISRALKRLAIELSVPVVAVSQLSRAPEARTDKRPILSDLRDSGGLEQDADVVIFVHRDDYYDKESPRCGEGDLIVAKQRNGPTDTVTVAHQLHLSRFVDMALP